MVQPAHLVYLSVISCTLSLSSVYGLIFYASVYLHLRFNPLLFLPRVLFALASRVFVPASCRQLSRLCVNASIVHVYSSPRLLLWYLCISSTRLSCPFVGRHLRVSFFVLASWVCRVPVLSRQGVPCTLSSWFLSVRVCRVPNLRGNLSVLSPDVHLSPRPSFVSPFLSCCQLQVLASLRNIRLTARILSTSPPIVFPAVSPICLQSFSVSSAPPPPLVQFIDTSRILHLAGATWLPYRTDIYVYYYPRHYSSPISGVILQRYLLYSLFQHRRSRLLASSLACWFVSWFSCLRSMFAIERMSREDARL